MKTHERPTPLDGDFATAQRQAVSLAGPPRRWRPRAAGESARRLLGLAAASIAAGSALGWAWVATATGGAEPGPAAVPTPIAAPLARPVPAPVAAPPVLRHQPASADRPVTVTRHGDRFAIALDAAPLALAVDAIAAATHTSVHGVETLARVGDTVTLHWEGASVAAAWEAVLGGIVNTAVSCGPRRCDLWIVSLRGTGRAPAGTPGAPSVGDTAAPTAPAGAALPPPPAPPPDDTETN